MYADDVRFDAHHYASQLLAALDAPGAAAVRGANLHPALRWAECGAMALTGRAAGPATMCPAPLASCADGALLALESLAADDGALPTGGELLSERAALAGLTRRGRVSPGGSCRLLDCADGRVALSLARAEDWTAVPAWLAENWRGAARPEDWGAIAAAVVSCNVDPVLDRGRLLSLAVAADRLPANLTGDWLEIDCEDPRPAAPGRTRHWSSTFRRCGPGRSARICSGCWARG